MKCAGRAVSGILGHLGHCTNSRSLVAELGPGFAALRRGKLGIDASRGHAWTSQIPRGKTSNPRMGHTVLYQVSHRSHSGCNDGCIDVSDCC